MARWFWVAGWALRAATAPRGMRGYGKGLWGKGGRMSRDLRAGHCIRSGPSFAEVNAPDSVRLLAQCPKGPGHFIPPLQNRENMVASPGGGRCVYSRETLPSPNNTQHKTMSQFTISDRKRIEFLRRPIVAQERAEVLRRMPGLRRGRLRASRRRVRRDSALGQSQ